MRYGFGVNCERWLWMAGTCGWLIAGLARADVDATGDSRYSVIVVRNPFGLKTNTPPPTVAELPKPPVTGDVKLAGITTDAKGKRAWLVFLPNPGRPPAPGAPPNQPQYYALREGDTQDEVKVVAINHQQKTVSIMNAGTALTLDFTNNAPTAVAVPVAAVPGAPGSPIRMAPGAIPPNKVGAGGIPLPGQRLPGAVNVNPANPYGGGAGARASGGVGSMTSGGTSGNLGNLAIPSRPTRGTVQDVQQVPDIDPVAQRIQMEQQQEEARQRGIPLPPLPPMR